MHIISTPARRRIAGTGLVVGLAVAGAAYAVPALAANGSIDVDATSTYSCDVWIGVSQVPDPPTNPSLADQPVTSEIQVTLPNSVKQGDTLPSTSVSITNDVSALLGLAQLIGGKSATGSSPDVAVDLLINNKHVTSPLVDVSAGLTPIPTAPPWLVAATGTTSPIHVPQDATGDIVISGPQQFTIISEVSQSTDGSNPIPSALLCQATAGEDLTIARINVTPVSTPKITVTKPPSSVYGKAVTVPVRISVPAGGIQPTGLVLLSRPGGPGKPDIGIAQADIDSNGKASVRIPGIALPVRTNTVKVTYAGDSNTRPVSKTILVTKTKATPDLSATVRPAKAVARETFPSVNVKVTGPGSHRGGPLTVIAGGQTRNSRLGADGHGSIRLHSFTAAGAKSIHAFYAGNAFFKPVTATLPLQVVKDSLSSFTAKAGPATVNVTRPALAVKLATNAGPAGGTVTVRSDRKVVGSGVVHGSGKITLNRFASVGRKGLRVHFAGTRGIAAKTITVPLRVKKANLTTFAVKVSPAKIIAKTTRAVLTVTLAAPANTGHGLVTVKRAGRALAKARVGGTRKIPLPAFAAAGKKVVKLVFAGNAVVKGKTISHTIRVVKG